MIALFGDSPAIAHACSRAACEAEASWALVWRNPKIHRADRRKTWLACDDHLDYLREFLSARDFPLEVLPVTELEAAAL